MKIRTLCGLLAILLATISLRGEMVFRLWNEGAGLPSDQIRSFATLDDGRMAIRVPNGVIIFDGHEFAMHPIDRSRLMPLDNTQRNIYPTFKDAKGYLWLKSPQGLSIYDPAFNRFHYDADSLLEADYGYRGHLRDIFIDSQRDIWVVGDNSTLTILSPGKDPRPAIRLDKEWQRRNGHIVSVSDNASRVYLLTSSGVIHEWDKTASRMAGCDETFRGTIDDPDKKFRMVFDPKGNRWAMYGQGVWRRGAGESTWRRVLGIDGSSNFFTSIAADRGGNIWVGSSWSGLRVINGGDLEVDHYPFLTLETGETLNNDIQEIHIDPAGSLWIGTLWQGIAFRHEGMNPFRTIHPANPAGNRSRSNESARSFAELPGGDILIGTSYAGIMQYNPQTGALTPFRPDLFPADDVYLTLYRDRSGSMWVGTYLRGFTRLMPDGEAKRYNIDPSREINVSRAIFEDSDGHFWVSANDRGVGRLDLSTGRIHYLSDLHPSLAAPRRDISITGIDDNLFIVSGDNGIYLYDYKTSTPYIPANGDGNPRYHLVGNGTVYDGRSLVWSATDEGVFCSVPHEGGQWGYKDLRFRASNSPLPSDYVSSVVEDRFGQIWLTTPNGIVRIIVSPDENKGEPYYGWQFDFTEFNWGDGLNAGRVADNASFVASNGDIYIGGFNGVIRFNPLDLATLKTAPVSAPLITGLVLFNKAIEAGDTLHGRIPVTTSLLNGQTVTLRHDENFLNIKFSSLDFVSGKHVRYRFRLKGFDPDWVELGPSDPAEAVYTGLPPGRYTFEVMSAGIDGIWSATPATFTLVISAPWYATWWACLLYLLAASLVVFLAVRWYIRHKARRTKDEAEKTILLQQQRLNEMKFQFFTNISHEFRTPLTLIMTPLSKLLKENEANAPLHGKLNKIYSHAEGLMGLVSRLLDFRRLEMGGEKLNLSRCRVVQYITCLTDSFADVAASKEISLSTTSSIPEDTDIYADTHKLRHILTNLIANSIKFTPQHGSITVAINGIKDEKGTLKDIAVSVTDTGCGIAPEKLPRIFDRFYQAENADNPRGSGIGLHLVKSFVELHKGEIKVTSTPGEGSVFTFTIPADLNGGAAPAPQEDVPASDTLPSGADRANTDGKVDPRPTVLVVEDNREFREFLAEYLGEQYHILQATDGVEALEILGQNQVSLIITDLMMPRMDGNVLINKIKKDVATSHIPVILLTAKASDETRIESYRIGADSYISKPFNYDILASRVASLLEQAKLRQRRFHADTQIEPSAVTITSLDEKIVKKALETVEKNIDNTAFSTTQLGEALGLSRSQLYRKFESLTGMSPADFIMRMRLRRAAQLLRDSKLNVSEIADMSGFNSIKYFNKHFKEEFSMTPTEYRASQTK